MKPKHPRFTVNQVRVPGFGKNQSEVCESPSPRRMSDMHQRRCKELSSAAHRFRREQEIEPFLDTKEAAVRLEIYRTTRIKMAPRGSAEKRGGLVWLGQ
jgi:hypothetical protein